MVPSLQQQLEFMLIDMDVPPDRYKDIHWLNRNLGIRNKYHPDFNRAQEIIRSLLVLR